ncbi:HlyD family efflux transporter periplasmic adaptor subunit [Oribacterium sp. WCC10]|uniref:HlyD family efflux transporter periplasmic adaptor subunit n=1 Tax=Oribacterium sp. WCC10 TaxID=1855343 RepID=UPI0008DFC596|nr:HlyD family efflux transporter periplasmic adaptor subunit [Oribacterium sp. WCC10]SFG61799.1 HlyD family secretion protein [Oribacterium sp. WCC10]
MKFKLPVKKLIIGTVVLAMVAGGGYYYLSKKTVKAAGSTDVKTDTVSRQTIQSSLSSSGTISPKDSYKITSMVDGTIISADFQEGDVVEEGQVLYQIDASSMDSKLSSANSSLERSENSYSRAANNYDKAVSDFSGNTVKSKYTGHIKTLNITIGDQVSSNTEIAEIYDDSTMKLDVPFLSVEAAMIPVGSTASVIIEDTLEEIYGTVTSVDSMETTLSGGQLVRYVTIEVSNPGGLTTDMAATASINGMNSSGDGTFEAARDFSLKADNLTSSVTVTQLLVNEGDYVTAGQALFVADADDINDIIYSYKDKLDSAKSSVESAQSSLDSTTDTYENYTITAPISGTVVTKSVNVGENVQNGSSATSLAVIYDLTEVTFEMNIDELDISNVKVGQEVEVTADAFEDETFKGTVTKISMEGTSSNGVTYYPVTVTMTEFGGLLPGMNVEGVIILDEAENALAIPVDALQRGNKVYVKNKDGETYDSENSDEQKSSPDGSDVKMPGSGSNVPDGFHSVTVETGLTSDSYVEIVSGDLEEGDEVYVSQSTVSDDMSMMMGGFGDQGGPGGSGGPGGGSGGPSGGPGGGSGGSRSGGGGGPF